MYKTRRERRYRRKQAKAAAIDPDLTRGWGPDSKITRGDLRRVATAIRRGWDVPANVRSAIVARVGEILDNDSSTDKDARLLIAAGSAVIQMVADDQRRAFQRIYAELGMPLPKSLL